MKAYRLGNSISTQAPALWPDATDSAIPASTASVKMLIFIQGPAISGLDCQAHLWGDRLVVFVNQMKKDGRHQIAEACTL